VTKALRSYAQTSVSPGQSRENIEKLLRRVGVEAWRWTTGPDVEGIEFALPRPGKAAAGYRLVIRFENQAERGRMLRVLYWYLKSKIEAIEEGLVSMEQEFLSHMLMPGGDTVYEAVTAEGLERLVAPAAIALPAPRG